MTTRTDRTDYHLADEPGQRLRLLFRSASALHQNFYEGDMPEKTVADGLDDMDEIVGRLQAVID